MGSCTTATGVFPTASLRRWSYRAFRVLPQRRLPDFRSEKVEFLPLWTDYFKRGFRTSFFAPFRGIVSTFKHVKVKCIYVNGHRFMHVHVRISTARRLHRIRCPITRTNQIDDADVACHEKGSSIIALRNYCLSIYVTKRLISTPALVPLFREPKGLKGLNPRNLLLSLLGLTKKTSTSRTKAILRLQTVPMQTFLRTSVRVVCLLSGKNHTLSHFNVTTSRLGPNLFPTL